jgi:hypothetical protein
MIIVISHIFNEEFLLPYWIRHHTRICDHGVFINYHCTDSSLDIIKAMVPEWDVVEARKPYFGAVETDQHVMDIERELEEKYPGSWKVALNTTEFLLHEDIHQLLKEYKGNELKGIGTVMVDHPEQRTDPLWKPDLYSQKFFGRFDLQHQRLIHRNRCGHYATGRHTWLNEGRTPLQEDLFILWFGWCPIEYVKERKLQIQTKIPDHDKKTGHGWHHHMDLRLLEKRYMEEEVSKSYWLFCNDKYVRTLESLHDQWNLGNLELPMIEMIS